MDRRITEFRWHCGPHPCEHAEREESERVWRYAVASGELAYSLTIGRQAGELALHRSFALPGDGAPDIIPAVKMNVGGVTGACDLVTGGQCLVVPTVGARIGTIGVTTHQDVARGFFATHAAQGKLEQPEKFWRELERIARLVFDDARKGRFAKTCPRCHGDGWVPFKAAKAAKAKPIGPA